MEKGIGIVDLHAQVRDEPRSTEQSEEQQDTAKMVNELWLRSKRRLQTSFRRFQENRDFFLGRQWSRRRPSYRCSEAINICWAYIQTLVPIMTDNRPKTEYKPPEPDDREFSEILTQVNDSLWEKYSWDFTLTQAIIDSMIYDYSHMGVFWNPELEDGMGDVELKLMSPWNCFPDLSVPDINPFGRYFIHAEPVPLGEMKRQYPEQAHLLHSDVESLMDRVGRDEDRKTIFHSPQDAGRPEPEPEMTELDKPIMKVQCWLRDNTTIEECLEDDDGNKRTVTKRKWPNGRYIVIANNIILRDEEMPYKDGMIPVVKLVDHGLPREYAGMGEIDQVKGIQRLVNTTTCYIADTMKQSGNPIWLFGATSGVEVDNVTNEPGLKITATDVNQVKRFAGEGMPGYIMSYLDNLLGLGNLVSGVQDTTRGAVQPGVTSGLMLEGFIEAAQTRIRLKNRNLDKAIREIGRMVASRIMQFYGVPRVFRITNKQGFPEFFEFFVTEEGNQQYAHIKRAANGPNMGFDKKLVKGMPDVSVTSGSALPFVKAQKAATAITLFNNGIIDEEEVLKAHDWPNKEEVLRRVVERKQAMAQQAGGGQ